MPRYLQADPEHFDLRDLKCKFDVILLEPPLEEYYRESGISHTERFWNWDDVRLAPPSPRRSGPCVPLSVYTSAAYSSRVPTRAYFSR